MRNITTSLLVAASLAAWHTTIRTRRRFINRLATIGERPSFLTSSLRSIANAIS